MMECLIQLFPAGEFGRSAARVEIENLSEDLSLWHGARHLQVQLHVSFHIVPPRCVLHWTRHDES
jgi:hypothetical protein